MGESASKKPQSDRGYEKKKRPCLMCQEPFMSSWPGERVCTNCKSTNAWRDSGIAA